MDQQSFMYGGSSRDNVTSIGGSMGLREPVRTATVPHTKVVVTRTLLPGTHRAMILTLPNRDCLSSSHTARLTRRHVFTSDNHKAENPLEMQVTARSTFVSPARVPFGRHAKFVSAVPFQSRAVHQLRDLPTPSLERLSRYLHPSSHSNGP